MAIYVNLVELPIACDPIAFYRVVATPEHWPRFHPSTAAVSPITGVISEPAEVGVVFSETIRRASGTIEARWEVTEANPGRALTLRSRQFAELPITMTISYRLERVGEHTRVERFMRTDVHPGHTLPREVAIHFSLPDIHEAFLEILKKHLE